MELDNWEPFKPEYDNAMVIFMVFVSVIPVLMSRLVFGHLNALRNESMLPMLIAWGVICLINSVILIHTPFAILFAIQSAGSLLFAGVCHLEVRHERLRKIVEAIS